jgi:hypothetical protein
MDNNTTELSKYDRLYVFVTDEGFQIVFRPVPWKTFRRIREILFKLPQLLPSIEEDIFHEYVVQCPFTEDELDANAGIITTVFSLIMSASGAATPHQFIHALEQARNKINSDLDQQIQTLLLSVYSITPEQLDNMTWPEILLHLAKAEKILGGTMPEVPLTFDGAEKKKPQKGTFEWQRDGLLAGSTG